MSNSLPTGGTSLAKGLIYIVMFAIISIAGCKFLQKAGFSMPGRTGGDRTTSSKDYTEVPKEYTINYVPADFQPEYDEKNALAILNNPYRYNREFNQMVSDINISLLNHVATRMGLDAELQQQIEQEYLENHHDYLKQLYFNDFVALKDTTSAMYDIWYNSEASDAVDILNEIASKYTCFLVNQVITSVLKTNNGNLNIKGAKIDTPCGVAITEGLKPMIARLQERAAVEDFSRSKGFMEERIERAIAELATMEVTDKKGLNKSLQTKVMGFNVSSTDLEISAISVLKVGFDLSKYFDITLDASKNRVTVTLPEPQILSHEVYPSIDKLDIGWMREIGEMDFNKNINVLRKAFRQDAQESDIMDKSKDNVTDLMTTMLTPLVKSMNKNYELKIRFKDVLRDDLVD